MPGTHVSHGDRHRDRSHNTFESLGLPEDDLTPLPPSPIQSPIVDPIIDRKDEEAENEQAPAKKYAPGLWRRYLYRVHQYSTYSFSAFLVLHFSTAVVVPTLTSSLNAGDKSIILARVVYQSQVFEPLILGSLAAHVLSGITLRLHRILRDKKWYSKRSRLSRVSFTGVLLTPLALAHILVCRVAPVAVDGDNAIISLRYISRGADRLPQGTLLAFYTSFIALSAYHVSYGWAKWLRVRKSRMKYVRGIAAVACITGVLALRVIWKDADQVPIFVAAKYDEMYDFVESLFLSRQSLL
ncbi:uncharacterized protein V2V93DRAFT_373283 [Kockiozyma suomiensis]|uniref:uncharacterized protein n=1 Tax=Kockiozyma suomiensis TaxID=1337062 RepID=UPI003343B876